MEDYPRHHGDAEGEGQEARSMEHVSAQEPLHSGCWILKSRVWFDG
jgi:hypothetical protein